MYKRPECFSGANQLLLNRRPVNLINTLFGKDRLDDVLCIDVVGVKKSLN